MIDLPALAAASGPGARPLFRLGEIVDDTPITVRFGGDTTGDSDVAGVPCNGLYAPTVGDLVYVAMDGEGGLMILCPVTGSGSGPRGVIAYEEATANQTGITAATDLTGLTVTWTVEANRFYRVMLKGRITKDGTQAECYWRIADGATNTKTEWMRFVGTSGTEEPLAIENLNGKTPGSYTRNGRLESQSGAVDLSASTTFVAFIVVEDLGASV